MREFDPAIHSVWEDIISLNQSHKLVNVFSNRIEAIN